MLNPMPYRLHLPPTLVEGGKLFIIFAITEKTEGPDFIQRYASGPLGDKEYRAKVKQTWKKRFLRSKKDGDAVTFSLASLRERGFSLNSAKWMVRDGHCRILTWWDRARPEFCGLEAVRQAGAAETADYLADLFGGIYESVNVTERGEGWTFEFARRLPLGTNAKTKLELRWSTKAEELLATIAPQKEVA